VESGQVLVDLGEFSEALVAYQRAAALHRRLGDRGREAGALDGTGTVYRRLDRHDEAADFHRMAVSVFRDTGERWHLAIALDNLANALRASASEAEADQCWNEALELLADFTDSRSDRLQHTIRERRRRPT
jgi:tetratricopeptide (TPR) repeat protein